MDIMSMSGLFLVSWNLVLVFYLQVLIETVSPVKRDSSRRRVILFLGACFLYLGSWSLFLASCPPVSLSSACPPLNTMILSRCAHFRHVCHPNLHNNITLNVLFNRAQHAKALFNPQPFSSGNQNSSNRNI
jgi:hypothetical protein